ncbi:MAGI3 [Cordylochernes scorpioides]|uniref:MAGI3 n=1 Tax=Cordylochernes scorpioides TaxID=51811 RepID=A0ABY6KY55_9ARAC|nr:MAGI3 [Cordylochernes scorpioides]
MITTMLVKGSKGLGFTVVGGEKECEFLQIKSVVPHGVAWCDGKLQTGDVLVEINGTLVLGYQHPAMVALFQSIPMGAEVTLTVCRGYPLPFDLKDPHNEVHTTVAFSQELISVDIVKGPEGFGFTIADSSYGQKVKKILDAERCKRLQEGDVLVQVNAQQVRATPHSDVVALLKSCPAGKSANLVVQRGGQMVQVRAPKSKQSSSGGGEPKEASRPLYRSKTPTADLFSSAVREKEIIQRPKTPLVDTRHWSEPNHYSSPQYSSGIPQYSSSGQYSGVGTPNSHYQTSVTPNSGSHYQNSAGHGTPNSGSHYQNPGTPNSNRQYPGSSVHGTPTSSQYAGAHGTPTSSQYAGVHGTPTSSQYAGVHGTPTSSQYAGAHGTPTSSTSESHYPPAYLPHHYPPSHHFSHPSQYSPHYYPPTNHYYSPSPTLPAHHQLSPNTSHYGTSLSAYQDHYQAVEPGPLADSDQPYYPTRKYYCSGTTDPYLSQFFHPFQPCSYEPFNNPPNNNNNNRRQYSRFIVSLQKQDNGFGFRILGGTEEGTKITIGHIVPGGAADLDGRIKMKDELLAVDGQNVMGASHHQVVQLMAAAAQTGYVNLTLRRPSSYDVNVLRREDEGFGFVIISSVNRAGSTIGRIIENSPADRCGQLRIGDKILAVNGMPITQMQHGEIVNLIKDSGYSVLLTVEPNLAMAAALQKIDIDPEQQLYTSKIVDIAAAVIEMETSEALHWTRQQQQHLLYTIKGS